MALLDEVRNRWSSQILVAASNPQSSLATTEDVTRENNAVSDVQAAFKVLCGVAYDNTVDTHVMYAVEGVLTRLLVMTGQASREDWNDWKRTLKEELALVTGRDRIKPSTKATKLTTADKSGEYTATDRRNFDRRFIPNPPGGGVGDDRTTSDT